MGSVPSPTGGRRVTVRGEILGLAPSGADVIEFLRRAGLPDAENLLDGPAPCLAPIRTTARAQPNEARAVVRRPFSRGSVVIP
ncbi:hypothetical protein [Streptomyces sp. NPDC021622]|uniref:hypothetical protein n=1 Tax=Streptomyces sp. NPDC021622 TaxID=3155013 RepID=UPI0033D4324C